MKPKRNNAPRDQACRLEGRLSKWGMIRSPAVALFSLAPGLSRVCDGVKSFRNRFNGFSNR